MVWVVLAVTVVPAFAQVKLAWKLKEGDTFYLETSVLIKQEMKSNGKEVKQDTDNTTVTRFTVKKKTKEGGFVLEQKIESVKVKAAPGPLTDAQKLADQMKGATLTLTLTLGKDFDVKIDGYEDLAKKIAKDDTEVGDLFRMMFPEETFQKTAGKVFGFLPAEAVAKNKPWKAKKMKIPLGPLGMLTAENKYTLRETTNEGAQISFTTDLDYSPPDKDSGKVPFKIVDGKLTADEASGIIVFDPDKGRLVRSEEKIVLKGTLKIEAAGSQFDLSAEQTITHKSRLLDKLPTAE
jgi:hypothetical protein